MVRTLIQVESDDACIVVVVHAGNIEQAVGIAEGRYPGNRIRLVFPLDPDTFFVRGSGAEAGLVELETSESLPR